MRHRGIEMVLWFLIGNLLWLWWNVRLRQCYHLFYFHRHRYHVIPGINIHSSFLPHYPFNLSKKFPQITGEGSFTRTSATVVSVSDQTGLATVHLQPPTSENFTPTRFADQVQVPISRLTPTSNQVDNSFFVFLLCCIWCGLFIRTRSLTSVVSSLTASASAQNVHNHRNGYSHTHVALITQWNCSRISRPSNSNPWNWCDWDFQPDLQSSGRSQVQVSQTGLNRSIKIIIASRLYFKTRLDWTC